MLDILGDYCNIYTSTTEWDRKARHELSQKWMHKTYSSLPDYKALIDFLAIIDGQNVIKISFPFEMKVIFPIFDKEIFENRNVEAMKQILFKYNYDAFLKYKNDWSINLLQMALSYAPNDIELLQRKFESQKRYYEYTLHEIPCGILYDMNGASIVQTKESLDGLNEFKDLCTRLDKNENALIEKCQFYYNLWIAYLTDKCGCANFEDFISKCT